MLLDEVRQSLTNAFDAKLVEELLDAYVEAKRNFYLGGLRLSEVEGGRFSEAALRMLQQHTTKAFTPLGKQIKSETVITALANLPDGSFLDAVRLHIPRALRLVYDIRNNRDAAHLADGIDANRQDASVVISVLDWVMAEFLRQHHAVSASRAQEIVEELVTRRVPAIQVINGYPKVIRRDIETAEYILLLLYHAGTKGATYSELEAWARPKMRSNLKRTLLRLVDEKGWAHLDTTVHRYYITESGMREVEARKLFEPS